MHNWISFNFVSFVIDIRELKQKQDIIAKQAQLVSIGELAGGVAHDINTPISAIRTGISMLKASDVEASVVTGAMNAHNTFDKPEVVTTEKLESVKIAEDGVRVVLPARSVTLLRVK